MFSKEYFNYLLKSKKYLLIFIVLVALLNVIGLNNHYVGFSIQCFLCIVLSYLIPCNVFYHVHDKKAVDTFFSIPVSRKAMLVSSIVFCVAVVYIPFAIVFTRYCFLEESGIVFYLLGMAKVLLCTFVMEVFNTTLYLSGNNAFDGVVMIGAYSMMPVFLLATISSFAASYIAGGSFDADYIGYLSPLFLTINTVVSFVGEKLANIHNIPALIIYGVVFSFLLYKSYVQREVERASSVSNKFYSYPAVIYIYVFMILLVIASEFGYSYSSVTRFVADVFGVYLMLFVVFVAAHFIYKRKLYFSYKLPLLFIVAMFLTLGIAYMAKTTKGFGLSEIYDHHDKTGQYSLYSNFEQKAPEELKTILEENNYGSDYVFVSIEAGNSKHNAEISDDSLALFDKYRKTGIEFFYKERRERYNYLTQNSTLNITSSDDRNYYYGMEETLTFEDMLNFAKDGNVKVLVSTHNGEYRLLEDGSLRAETVYYPEIVTE